MNWPGPERQRYVMKTARLTLLPLLFLFPWMGPAQQRGKTPVVLITIDTLRADRLPEYGYTKAKTPNISALARDGVVFNEAYVQAPITLPSHASILTGTYPMFHRVQDVVGRLRDGVPTLATVLKKADYATGAFVGATVLSSRWMLNRGFDRYDDHFDAQEGLRQVDFDRIERKADDVMDPAIAWLGTVEKRPFFLWVHLYDPHDPYAPPAPFASEFRDRPYDGEVAYVDFVLGKLFQTLKQRGLYESSLIVFTADHGESLGEHQEAHHGYFIYEASLRVPLIFKLPAGQFRGTRVANIVRSVDIAPTVLQHLQITPPPTIQGESLLAMTAGKRAGASLSAYAESYYPKIHFNWSPLFSLRSGQYKYIDAPQAELYDVPADPGEANNLIKTHQAVANKLKAELQGLQKRYASDVVEASETAARQLDPETMARLKSLGYVSFSSATPTRPGAALPDPKSKIQVYNQLNRGIFLSRRGMSDKAIETFTQVAEAEPNMPIAHFLLGMEYFEKAWYLKAIEEFKATIEHNPDSNVAMFNLARAYLESGQADKAEAGFRHLLEREPGHFAARHYLSLSFARRSRFQEAAEEEIKALQLRPDYVEGHNNLGSFYLNLGQIDKAIESYRKALSLRPALLVAGINLSLAYLKKGAYDEAIQSARDVITRDARRSLAHFYLGQAYLGKGLKDEARQAFQKAKELDPKLNVPAI